MKILESPSHLSPKRKYAHCASSIFGFCGDSQPQIILQMNQSRNYQKQQKISLKYKHNKNIISHHIGKSRENMQVFSFKSCDKGKKQSFCKNQQLKNILLHQTYENTSKKVYCHSRNASITQKQSILRQTQKQAQIKTQGLKSLIEDNINYQEQFQKILFQSAINERQQVQPNNQKNSSCRKTLNSFPIFDSQSMSNSAKSSLKSSVVISNTEDNNKSEAVFKVKTCSSIIDLRQTQIGVESIIFGRQFTKTSFRNILTSPSKR